MRKPWPLYAASHDREDGWLSVCVIRQNSTCTVEYATVEAECKRSNVRQPARAGEAVGNAGT